MRSDKLIIWQAYCEADDYFSRLGGAGRYIGFSEYHIPALVLVLALEKDCPAGGRKDDLRRLLPDRMWINTDGLPERVKKIIGETASMQSEIIREFVEYVNMRLSSDELLQWRRFVKDVEDLGWPM